MSNPTASEQAAQCRRVIAAARHVEAQRTQGEWYAWDTGHGTGRGIWTAPDVYEPGRPPAIHVLAGDTGDDIQNPNSLADETVATLAVNSLSPALDTFTELLDLAEPWLDNDYGGITAQHYHDAAEQIIARVAAYCDALATDPAVQREMEAHDGTE